MSDVLSEDLDSEVCQKTSGKLMHSLALLWFLLKSIHETMVKLPSSFHQETVSMQTSHIWQRRKRAKSLWALCSINPGTLNYRLIPGYTFSYLVKLFSFKIDFYVHEDECNFSKNMYYFLSEFYIIMSTIYIGTLKD